MPPPSGSTFAPQMLPTPLQLWPLSHRPPLHITLPLGLIPPPQQALSFTQLVPVNRHPLAGKQTVAPEPGSKQVREQQFEPPLQGLPSCVHPPAPPPVMFKHVPTPPSLTLQAAPQHSALRPQRSPLGEQKYALAHLPFWHSDEQQSGPAAHESPKTLQTPPPGMIAQVFALQTPVQQSEGAAQVEPVAVHALALHRPFAPHEPLQQSAEAVHDVPEALQNVEAVQTEARHCPSQHGTAPPHACPVM